MAHITGGGLRDNLPRVLGDQHARIERGSWEVGALFNFLCERGGIDLDEAHQVFNMGVGMVAIVAADDAGALAEEWTARGERTALIGTVGAGAGPVVWS